MGFDKYTDVTDSRAVIARIEELERERNEYENGGDQTLKTLEEWEAEEGAELASLLGLIPVSTGSNGKAERLAQDLNAHEEEGWTYKAKDGRVEVYDDEGVFVGKLLD